MPIKPGTNIETIFYESQNGIGHEFSIYVSTSNDLSVRQV